MDYAVIGGAGGATVIYATNALNRGEATCIHPKVEAFLRGSRIQRVFTGHVPHGDCPTVVRHPKSGLIFVTADTSYSDPAAPKNPGNPADSRGSCAASIVGICGDMVELRGVLADGKGHCCQLRSDPSRDRVPDALVGRKLSNGGWVKSLSEGQVYVASAQGFQVTGQRLTTAEAHAALLPEHSLSPQLAAKLKKGNFKSSS